MASVSGDETAGLSPRGRGKQEVLYGQRARRRSIPAWAGETAQRRRAGSDCQVYPRVGGGNDFVAVFGDAHAGLSPRGRGKPADFRAPALRRGSIPAWAGETAHARTFSAKSEVYPRVGGGNVDTYEWAMANMGLSPRGRGKLPCGNDMGETRRSIPAWAGETSIITSRKCALKVYPRVGGGNHSHRR